MPDPPPPKRQSRLAANSRQRSPVPYAELHCRTNFSFLEGASHPDELVHRAAELGYEALAVTDRNSLAGVVRAHVAAKQAGLKLLIGAEITPADAPPVMLLATDRAAYGRLSQLITLGRRRAKKGECVLRFDDIADHAEGLLAGVSISDFGFRISDSHCRSEVGSRKSGGGVRSAECGVRSEDVDRSSILDPPSSSSSEFRVPSSALQNYRDLFADRCYLLAELHHGPDDRLRLEQLKRLAQQSGVPLVAANDVHYHEPTRRFLQDVLSAIRNGCTVAELGERMFSNAERYLKSPEQMAELFAEIPEAIARTAEIAGRCQFSLDELRYEYPEELCPPGVTPIEHLTRLTWAGARQRYPHGVPDKVRGLIEHELKLIEELRYEAYFLTVWDLVRFARSRDILCQGRGSAANSAVCYCLGVTSVDPERIDVLFERFVSKERNEAPDIDVDFEHERREEVLQYIYQKYGRDRAGMTAEVITYRPRSAVRDVGKALGLSLEQVDRLAKSLENYSEDEKLASRFREAGTNPVSPLGRQLIALVRQILGFPRHLSQHVGGMVMTQKLLCELVPIENASMPNRTVIQWDKNDLDSLGILKVDCLALGMLTAIHKCFGLIADCGLRIADWHCKSEVEDRSTSSIRTPHSALPAPSSALMLAAVPPEDPAVYEMIQKADTMGVFQIESRAQMSMLPRLRPACFYDLVIEVAIVRPGPIQGDMVHPYLRRRRGEEPVEYPDERIRAVLEKTLGVPIFQEQAMRLAVVAAGFTPGEADQLRRAMGAWRRRGVIDRFQKKLIDGMQANGYPVEFAERVYRQIRGFGEYGFPESHAASFALLVYVSAWLKRYHPAAFTAALLNSQPMGFYAPAQLIGDARKHGVEVRPVDVNASEWDCTLEPLQSGVASRKSEVGSRKDEDGGWMMEDGGSEIENRATSSSLRTPHSALRTSNSDFRLPTSDLHRQSANRNPNSAIQTLRLGFRLVSGLSRSHVETIVACRRDGPFASFEDFAQRTGLSNAVLKRLSKADALASLGMNRREALWQSLPVQRELPLFESGKEEGGRRMEDTGRKSEVGSREGEDRGSRIEDRSRSAIRNPQSEFRNQSSEFRVPSSDFASLPPMSPFDEVVADYRAIGLSLRDHPLKFIRPKLKRLRAVSASDLTVLPTGRRVKVAGLVLLRQRPSTASGITFVTLEDETGFANLIVRPEIWERYHQVARTAQAMLAHGFLQKQDEVIHVLVHRLEDLSSLLSAVRSPSRDFR